MRRQLLPGLAAAAVVGALLGAGAAGAQTPGPAGSQTPGATAAGAQVSPAAVAEVARELNCPVCQGYTLQDCPLLVCAQMRDLIRQRLAEGQTKDEIIAAFVAEYGPQVLNAPPRKGFHLLAWLLPLIVLAGAVTGLGLFLRRGTGAAPATGTAAPAAEGADPSYVAQLEQLVAGADGEDSYGRRHSAGGDDG